MELRRLLFLGFAPVALGALALAGCGGDDDDDGGGGGGSRTGSDEEFVTDLCAALKDFNDDISEVFSDPESFGEDEDKIAEAMSEPFRNLADSFDEMRVPNDLKDWHSDASEAMNKLADQLEDGNFDEASLEEDPFEDPPQDVIDRLQKLADDNEDCQDADFNFDE